MAVLPRLGEKSADNIIAAIRNSVQVPFPRVLYALGIRFVGETTARNLALHFGNLDALDAASHEALIEAEEVGGRIAESLIEYLADAENRQIIERLRTAGVQLAGGRPETLSESLGGKSFVVTGSFAGRSRDQLRELIELHGGKYLSAVSANTDFLLAGDNVGATKLAKARKLGVKSIGLEDFLNMLDGKEIIEKQSLTTITKVNEDAEREEEKEDSALEGNPVQGTLF